MTPTPLDLLLALHAHPALSLQRVGGRVRATPRVPAGTRGVLAHYREALVRALRDGERVEVGDLIHDPARLAALLAHALGAVGLVALRYGSAREGPPFLVLPGNLTPHLAWASHHQIPLQWVHLHPPAGGWDLEVHRDWRVALEAGGRGGRLALLPATGAGAWLQRLREEMPLPDGVRVWRRAGAPLTASSWEEALGHLEAAHALH